MPTLADMQAAIPRCPQTVFVKGPGVAGSPPQRATCYGELKYKAGLNGMPNEYGCASCRRTTRGSYLVQLRAVVGLAEAA